MTEFQIRDDSFGLATYTAETASEALAAFIADQERGRARAQAQAYGLDNDGIGTLRWRGRTYYACPPGTADKVPNSGASG